MFVNTFLKNMRQIFFLNYWFCTLLLDVTQKRIRHALVKLNNGYDNGRNVKECVEAVKQKKQYCYNRFVWV